LKGVAWQIEEYPSFENKIIYKKHSK
jgi:hypothetical protein